VPEPAKKPIPVTVKLSPQLVQELDDMSRKEFRSRAMTVKLALTSFLETARRTEKRKHAAR